MMSIMNIMSFSCTYMYIGPCYSMLDVYMYGEGLIFLMCHVPLMSEALNNGSTEGVMFALAV